MRAFGRTMVRPYKEAQGQINKAGVIRQFKAI